MELLIFVLIARTLASTSVQEECEKCIAKSDHAFYKIIWSVSAPTEYICRSNANLISKFGYVVDSACDQEACGNLSIRPLLRHGRRYGYYDCRKQETIETSNHHATIVAVIRDYLEILLMSIVCAILVLKKRILLECINSHRQSNKAESENLQVSSECRDDPTNKADIQYDIQAKSKLVTFYTRYIVENIYS